MSKTIVKEACTESLLRLSCKKNWWFAFKLMTKMVTPTFQVGKKKFLPSLSIKKTRFRIIGKTPSGGKHILFHFIAPLEWRGFVSIMFFMRDSHCVKHEYHWQLLIFTSCLYGTHKHRLSQPKNTQERAVHKR